MSNLWKNMLEESLVSLDSDKKYIVRTSCMNLTMKQWEIVRSLPSYRVQSNNNENVRVTIKEFHDKVGFGGGMFNSRNTEEEKEFIEKFYQYGGALKELK